MNIRPFLEQDEQQVIKLWQRCGMTVPWNNPAEDIRRKLDTGRELFIVGLAGDSIVASAMGGYEGHRGWINYLAVEPELQGQDYGRQMMTHIEKLLHERGCPKINLQIRSTNEAVIAFYEKLGYKIDGVVSMGKRLGEA